MQKHKKMPKFRTECQGPSQEIKKYIKNTRMRFDKKFANSERKNLGKWHILQFFHDNFFRFEKDSMPSKVLIDIVETHIV